MTLMLSFKNSNLYNEEFLKYFIISALILFVFIASKKIVAYKIDTKVEIKLWQLKRYWITTKAYLEKPIPIGILLPLLLSFLSSGIVKFLAFTTFVAEARPSKVTKRYGYHRFQEVNDWDYALIAFYSLLAIMILAIICTFLNPYLPQNLYLKEIARLSLYFAISNLLPLGQLDGLRIFFGSRPLYIFTWILLAITGLIVFL
jgi:hypothetical protein